MQTCKSTVEKLTIRKWVVRFCWLFPLILQSTDAYAWGLVTHVYFAHSLLWAMPLLDPRLRQAIQRFPALVMAGACLPDLGLVAKEFRNSHQWTQAHRLLEHAQSDQELAIAIGYASHLYVDVIAHNHFVPAHEAMWEEDSMLTHIASEWAMDGHLNSRIPCRPGRLLSSNKQELSNFLHKALGHSQATMQKAIHRLAIADNLLRNAKLPAILYGGMKLLNFKAPLHFGYYISKTESALQDIPWMLNGIAPDWQAELKHLTIPQMLDWRRQCLAHLQLNHPLPIDYYASMQVSSSTLGTEH